MKHQNSSPELLCKCNDGFWRMLNDIISYSEEDKKFLVRHSGDSEEWVGIKEICDLQSVDQDDSATRDQIFLVPASTKQEPNTIFAEAVAMTLDNTNPELEGESSEAVPLVSEIRYKHCNGNVSGSTTLSKCLKFNLNDSAERFEHLLQLCTKMRRSQRSQEESQSDRNEKLEAVEPEEVPEAAINQGKGQDGPKTTRRPVNKVGKKRGIEREESSLNQQGYRLIRATHGTNEGAWYFEATIREDFQQDKDERFVKIPGHARLGWARASAYIQGDVVTMRQPKPYLREPPPPPGDTPTDDETLATEPAIKVGDVLGFYLYLPPPPAKAAAAVASEEAGGGGGEDGMREGDAAAPPPHAPDATEPQAGGDSAAAAAASGSESKEAGGGKGSEASEAGKGKALMSWHGERQKLLWKDSGIEYYLDEDKDTGTEICAGSCIRFSVNGVDRGDAFVDIQAGTYYPAASLYMGGHVTFNFGPDFRYPPGAVGPHGVPVRPISSLSEYAEQQ